MACRPGLIWAGVIAAAVAAEAHALLEGHREHTLSAMTRQAFRTEHPVGKAAFILGTAALAVWFQWHIVGSKSEVGELAEVFELHPGLAQEQIS